MAIDTAEKRRSVAGIPFWIGLGVTPNVAKDAEWRQQAGWGYSGIAAGGAPVVSGLPPYVGFHVNIGKSMGSWG